MKKVGSVIHLGKYSLMYVGEQECHAENEVYTEYYFQLESYCSKKITINSKNEISVDVTSSISSMSMMYPRYDTGPSFDSFNREFFITLLIVKDQILEVSPDIRKYNLLFDRTEQNYILKKAIEEKNKYKINETKAILSNINFELSLYEDQDLKDAWDIVNVIAPGYVEEKVG